MIIKYLRDTLFVSKGISYEDKGQYSIDDTEGKELIDTFHGYFEEVKSVVIENKEEPIKKSTKK